MVMFVLDVNGFDICNFNIDNQKFNLGQIIEHDRLDGKHRVIHLDPATVTVQQIK